MNDAAPKTSLFRYEVRVLACTQCGAPLDAAIPGSVVTCQYCQASLHVGTRDDRALLDSPAGTAVDEKERLRRLRAQDGQSLPIPPALAHLFTPEGIIAPEKMQETISLWNESRSTLTKAPNPELEERLYFLTLVLNQSLGHDTAGTHRKRALLESALEILRSARHRQILLCSLSRLAVLDGDHTAAQSWLNACDPCSEDLETDSHYRYAKAFLHTAKGQWQDVLVTLGHDGQTIPVHDALDNICYLMRANAHERLGDVDRATELLSEALYLDDHNALSFLDRMTEQYRQFQLCSLSYPMARERHLSVKGAGSSGTYKIAVVAIVLCAGLAILAAYLLL